MVKWVVKVWESFPDGRFKVIVERDGRFYDAVEFAPTKKLELREYLLEIVGRIIHTLGDGA